MSCCHFYRYLRQMAVTTGIIWIGLENSVVRNTLQESCKIRIFKSEPLHLFLIQTTHDTSMCGLYYSQN